MKTKLIALLIAICMMLAPTTGCVEQTKSAQRQGEIAQEGIMQRAIGAVPTPEVNNFLTRKAVVKWMQRMDTPSKIFYIYITTDMGMPIGYFVAQYRPVSTATFLTPTKRIVRPSTNYSDRYVLPSNALDGTYYGDGAAADQYFWFDAETDAMIELKDFPYILSDQPLSIDVPRIFVQTAQEEK